MFFSSGGQDAPIKTFTNLANKNSEFNYGRLKKSHNELLLLGICSSQNREALEGLLRSW